VIAERKHTNNYCGTKNTAETGAPNCCFIGYVILYLIDFINVIP
jgi:hypothetical protein